MAQAILAGRGGGGGGELPPHNYEYSGIELPFTWAQISAKIKAGDFSGIRVGDYKDILLNGQFFDAATQAYKTLTNVTMRMEVAGINPYIGYGDTEIGNHIDFISRDCVPSALMYNNTATNSNSYFGSQLYQTLNAANGLQKLLPADVAAVVIPKRGLMEVKTAATASAWAFNDMGKLWLPTEIEVWGARVWSEQYSGGLAVHYPIFNGSLRHVMKHANGARRHWWCASSRAGSASNFCNVNEYVVPNDNSAAITIIYVPLCFRVA